jgi:hypothetical protein
LSALQSPETVEAAGSRQNTPEDLLKTLKEKLDQSKLYAITPRKKVSDQDVVSRQQADGFVIDGVTYVKQDRLKTWFPDKSSQTALRQTGIFKTKRPDTSTVDKKIIGIEGKPRYYAIKAKALDRSSQ